ncbi:hypothetical protein [Aestuariivita sp.]|jgi:hypothetical protein|nr:hypothetical protein [Aestuariivita sp.]MCE8009379.1 hypothetical protein [Aestuariivita sp.]
MTIKQKTGGVIESALTASNLPSKKAIGDDGTKAGGAADAILAVFA